MAGFPAPKKVKKWPGAAKRVRALSSLAGDRWANTQGGRIVWGPPFDSVQVPCKWLNSMVYGRFITIVNGVNGVTLGL